MWIYEPLSREEMTRLSSIERRERVRCKREAAKRKVHTAIEIANLALARAHRKMRNRK